MSTWQLQEAKTRLSQLLEEAEENGPQTITRHGKARAILLSVRDYQTLTAHRPDLKAYLLGGPKTDEFAIPREHDTGRQVQL
jgi:prevent-host-death family protein